MKKYLTSQKRKNKNKLAAKPGNGISIRPPQAEGASLLLTDHRSEAAAQRKVQKLADNFLNYERMNRTHIKPPLVQQKQSSKAPTVPMKVTGSDGVVQGQFLYNDKKTKVDMWKFISSSTRNVNTKVKGRLEQLAKKKVSTAVLKETFLEMANAKKKYILGVAPGAEKPEQFQAMAQAIYRKQSGGDLYGASIVPKMQMDYKGKDDINAKTTIDFQVLNRPSRKRKRSFTKGKNQQFPVASPVSSGIHIPNFGNDQATAAVGTVYDSKRKKMRLVSGGTSGYTHEGYKSDLHAEAAVIEAFHAMMSGKSMRKAPGAGSTFIIHITKSPCSECSKKIDKLMKDYPKIKLKLLLGQAYQHHQDEGKLHRAAFQRVLEKYKGRIEWKPLSLGSMQKRLKQNEKGKTKIFSPMPQHMVKSIYGSPSIWKGFSAGRFQRDKTMLNYFNKK
ncbi:MAG: hypothetical protein AAFZ15_23530 [Bacteroidota bacterium]